MSTSETEVHLKKSITEPGDSSTSTGIGNLVRSRIFGHLKPKFSIGGLISVPHHLRKLDEQAFTPLLISIGPIHSSNAKLQAMKECKLQFCRCFFQRAKIDYGLLEQTIRDKEDEIRSYYAEAIVSSITSEDFVTMILVDGLFILEYFFRHHEQYATRDDPMNMIVEWMPSILKFDLALLENQLPFFVLEMLFNQANCPSESKLEDLTLNFFRDYNFQNVPPDKFDAKIEHFTDLVRFFHLNENLPERKLGGAKLSYSATQLHEVGIRFKVAEEEGRSFLDIKFDQNNGVLEIPCIKLNDEKIRLIRNIVALEQSLYVGHAYVTDFFVILNFLIDTSRDVDLLCDNGILVNYLGDSSAAASVVNNLNTNILWDYMNSEYTEICENLNAFYKKRWHKWRATLWRQYFSTPWRTASTSAAIILLVLTAIQTVCSLKSINW